jgi:hypothetical protein
MPAELDLIPAPAFYSLSGFAFEQQQQHSSRKGIRDTLECMVHEVTW